MSADTLVRLLNALASDCEHTDGWEDAAPTVREAADTITRLQAALELSGVCAKVEADAVAGLRYIERRYGRLEGVGWDRVFDAHDELFRLAAERDERLSSMGGE